MSTILIVNAALRTLERFFQAMPGPLGAIGILVTRHIPEKIVVDLQEHGEYRSQSLSALK
jgi:hypothetical protein